MLGRRRRARWIGFDPGFLCFKPCGRSGRGMDSVVLRVDELEALRLADLEGLYQEDCARRMGISRTTLSRTLTQARRKVTDALINGKRLVVTPAQELAEAPVVGYDADPVAQSSDETTPAKPRSE